MDAEANIPVFTPAELRTRISKISEIAGVYWATASVDFLFGFILVEDRLARQ